MAKNQHIVAVETALPANTGYTRCNPFEAISSDQVIIGYRPTLEELDPDANKREDGKAILQLIPYLMVRYQGEVLVYVRPSAGNESRLHGKVSIGLGGHVDIEDVVHDSSVVDVTKTIKLSANRELEEETGGKLGNCEIEWTGLIYRNDGPVDRVHLGIVGVVDLTPEQRDLISHTDEIGKIEFKSLGEIAEAYKDYEIEAWSKAILENAA